MKRSLFFLLFVAFVFSFFSCGVEQNDSSASITVLLPSESSEHGYQNSDLTSCKVELFGNKGESHIYSANFSSPVTVNDLKKGSLYWCL